MIRGLPFRVTVFVWVVLTLTVWNALRVWTAIAWRSRLTEFASVPGPVYIGISGAVWVLAGLLILWTFWTPVPWRRWLIAAGALLYTLWYWLDRLLFQPARADWPFNAILNLLLVLHVLYTLRSDYFRREAHEQ